MNKFISLSTFLLAIGFAVTSCSKQPSSPQEQDPREKEIAALIQEWEQKEKPLLTELKNLYDTAHLKDKTGNTFEEKYLKDDIEARNSLTTIRHMFVHPEIAWRMLGLSSLKDTLKQEENELEALTRKEDTLQEEIQKKMRFKEKMIDYLKKQIEEYEKILDLLLKK